MRHFILPALFFMTLSLFSQNSKGIMFNGKPGTMEYSFDEGLRRGRAANEFYKAEYSKNNLTDDKLYDFAKKNDLYIRRIKEKTIDRFGTKANVVIGWEFLPKKELDRFVFSVIADQNIVNSKIVNIFWPVDNYLYEDRVAWTGNVVNGRADGHGTAIAQTSAGYNYAYMIGTFKNGFLQGSGVKAWVTFEGFPEQINAKETARIKIEIGEFHEGLANCSFGEKFGFIDETGIWVIAPKYKGNGLAHNFSGGRVEVTNDKGEQVYIDRNGNFVDLTEGQKKIYAEAKAREQAKKDSIKAAEEHAKLLAQQKEAERRQKLEEMEKEYQRKIAANKNTKLWSIGCRLCYRFPLDRYHPDNPEYVLATLEEWSPDHSRVKVKVVASPGATWTLNGESLKKNNTMWVSARNEGWHLALKEEMDAAIRADLSGYEPKPKQLKICTSCSGRGSIRCRRCEGSGWYKYGGGKCYNCNGAGTVNCPSCGGSGNYGYQ